MPDPRKVAVVKANGKNYTAFKSIMVRREYNNTVSHFQMTCSEGGPLGGANDARRLVPGTPVEIWLGGVLALTGGVTTRMATYDANSHDVIIGGRSGTGDAADSTMNVTPGNFNGYTLEQAAKGALAPHGTQLKLVNPPAILSKPFPFLAVNPGETVMGFIERMCLMRGCFMWDDEKANLCVGQGDPSAAPVAQLEEGRNILRATITLDDQSLFNTYSMYGQLPSSGDEMATRTSQATVTDPSVRANRTRIGPSEHVGDADDHAARANLEASLSAWPSIEASVTVAGWTKPDGTLWGITENMTLYSPMGFPNGSGTMKLGTQCVVYSQVKDDEGEGTTTTFDLKRPELLTSTGHSDVSSDGTGGYGGDAQPAQPVAPDYQSGTSAGPGGTLGHA